ncbi:MAG: hypothetical protein JXA18_13175 [Chitinispirillaceae bacterium]|nr:hypothetical protein [Chitinispirillaceae bacterium]
MDGCKATVVAFVITWSAAVPALSAPPGLWMYTDEYGSPGYSGVELVDTLSFGPPYEVTDSTFGILRDDAYDYTESVMNHFKWPYRFTNGWAGCKLIWEDRDWCWDAYGYDSLVIKYIGPLATHKIDIYFGLAFTRFDTAFVEYIGSLPANYVSDYASEAWKTVSVPLPPAPTETPLDSARKYLREIRFLIHNAEGETAMTSDPGFFYLDKVGLIKESTAIAADKAVCARVNARSMFIPPVSGPVVLGIYSMIGKRLWEKSVPVVAGRQYSVRRFSREHAVLPSPQCTIVRIRGAGINIKERTW